MRKMKSGNRIDEIDMTTPQLIIAHGYKTETHYIWTDDGYRLEVHRVLPPSHDNNNANEEPSLKNLVINESKEDRFTYEVPTENGNALQEKIHMFDRGDKPTRPIVLILHGLLSSSADFVLLGPDKALAYALCDNGYDVWLANSRGNRYSRYHKTYTTKDKEFWDFSWHEIGLYDTPATVDYILEKTGVPSLSCVAYSQGTTAFFVMMSERPEYNAKINGVACLAPIAFLGKQRSPLLKFVVPLHGLMKLASSYCNINEWFPRNKLQTFALGAMLRNAPDRIVSTFCFCWFYLIAGLGSDQLDKSMLSLIFGHFPAGASTKQIVHYCQSIQSGIFQMFDYGPTKNTTLYGTAEPPPYSLDNIKIPVGIFHSDNDFLNHPEDVDKLAKELPNVIEKTKILYAKFNHIDYLWGRDVRNLLYNDIVKFIKRF